MKIAIIGAGNAGCVTALHYNYFLGKSCEIDIYHSLDTHPIERVGQGTLTSITELFSDTLKINWYNNPIGATIKTGVLYENWGVKNDKIFHDFNMSDTAIHFVPQKLSQLVLNSGKFNSINKEIIDPEKEIDADVIFDCRGRHNRKKEEYDKLINPLNSVLLCKKIGKDDDLIYTKCVATPNGWTFVIPNSDSVSYGYLYNNNITSKLNATEDFLSRFNLDEVDGEMVFENYVAKDFYNGSRTIYQGNMYGFIEPMEATSLVIYRNLCRQSWDGIFKLNNWESCNQKMRKLMIEIQNVILWHYQYGSKFDTPFWEYAKSLPFNPDDRFYMMLNDDKDSEPQYGTWRKYNFDNWKNGVMIAK